MITSLQKKGTQAINYFARKKDGRINKMKAIKLIYFADRYHLRKYGRPIIGDIYFAMKLGPVGSVLLDTANLQNNLEGEYLKYAQRFLAHPKENDNEEIISKSAVDLSVFSQTDIEALEIAFKEFGDKDQFELANITHIYPEWARHKKELDGGRKRVQMDYFDFFSNPKIDRCDIFELPEEHLNLMKEVYEEDREIVNTLG